MICGSMVFRSSPIRRFYDSLVIQIQIQIAIEIGIDSTQRREKTPHRNAELRGAGLSEKISSA